MGAFPDSTSVYKDSILYRIVDFASGAYSLSTFALLAVCILRYTPKEMKEYSITILLLSATDALISITLLLADFHWLFYVRHATGGFADSFLVFPNCGYVYFAAFLGSVALNWFILPICYTYRFVTLCFPTGIERVFNKYTISLCAAIYSFGCAAWCTVIFYAGVRHKSGRELNTDQLTNFTISPYTRNTTIDFADERVFVFSTIDNPLNWVWIYLCPLGLSVIYIYIFVISVLIVRYLRRYRNSMSPATYRAHFRVLRTLTFQTILPLTNTVGPICIFFGNLFFGGSSFYVIENLRMFYSCGVALNPSLTIALIEPYRAKVKELLFLVFGTVFMRFKTTAVVSTEPSANSQQTSTTKKSYFNKIRQLIRASGH